MSPTPIDTTHSALQTDLYELTMARAYLREGMDRTAVFELFFREMPHRRNVVIAAGLESVLSFLETFRFRDDDLAYLSEQSEFDDAFLDRLGEMRFTGDVWAVPEGTPVFPDEPIVQVVAPIVEAQLVETLILNQVHFQSVIASKAHRVAVAGGDKTVVDFGSRRAHGGDAAVKAARACYLAGLAGTSNVLAGKLYGVPIFGTMAHSYVQAHDDESAAFESYARLYPHTTLLVDTYDTLEGVEKVIELARNMGDAFNVRAVRLDSGDLGQLARHTRRRFDAAGLEDLLIFASGGLDEDKIRTLRDTGAPIDGFGVGTKLVVSEDAPSLDMAYKLVEYAGRGRTKLSTGKAILPGRKQVYRARSAAGVFEGDRIVPFDTQGPGRPLLQCVMQQGCRAELGHASLEDARTHRRRQVDQLPPAVAGLDITDGAYPVESDPVFGERREVIRQKRS